MQLGSHTFRGCLSGRLAGEGVVFVKFQTFPISKCVMGSHWGTPCNVNSCINENTYQLIAYELRANLYRYIFMNTDMNQFLIFRKCMGMLINFCEKNDSLSAESFVLGKLAHHLCL